MKSKVIKIESKVIKFKSKVKKTQEEYGNFK